MIPIEPDYTILEAHTIVIEADKILALLPHAVARQHYPQAKIIERHQHALLPGLINLHTHAAMNLMRGIGDDLPLHEWLQTRIWPVEAALMSDDFVFDGTMLACQEMLRGGITCFNDMYFFPDAAIRAAQAWGMRIVAGVTIIDFATAYARDANDYIERGLQTRAQWEDQPLVSFTLAPHAPYTVSDAVFKQVIDLSQRLNLPIHTHLHETQAEIAESEQRYGMRPLARLAKFGLLNRQLLAVHGVHLNEAELDALAHHGCHIAHCPSSNLKLGSGLPQLTAWQTHGINFGLGTDGAASNNRLDLWTEMRLAALLGKGMSQQASNTTAQDILHAATLGAAQALGLDSQIGSLAPGKQADCITVNLDISHQQPIFDVLGHLLYVCERHQVSDVWIGGRCVVESQHLIQKYPNSDSFDIQKCTTNWQYRIRDVLKKT